MEYLKFMVVFLGFFQIINCYKVLVFFPYPGKSHSILGEGYVRHLVKAGHNVTYVTPILIKNAPHNLRQIDVSSNFEKFELKKSLDIQKLLDKQVDLGNVAIVYRMLHDIAQIALMHDKVQNVLLDTSEEFDVAIVEWLYSELYAGVPAVFNCPYIWSSSMEPHPMVMELIGDISNPAYSPDHMSPLTPPLTFLERVNELWNVLKLYYIKWNMRDIYHEAWKNAYTPAFAKRGLQLPPFEDVIYNGSLMFGNSHVSQGFAVPLPQNYVPIAGYHINDDVQPLPKNLKDILDNSPQGVIYFSLGTLMESKTMPEELKRGFLQTFSKLKQTVVWKLETPLQDLPKNVHIVEWAPQQSILAHPNTILFITHGGLLSTTETLHFGVPIIGIPLFADQYINIKRAVAKGFAKHVEMGYDAPEKLKYAIDDILKDLSYREKVRELSAIYHKRSVSPGQEVVNWVEYVVETKGAKHLRSPALMLAWYQKIYLDLVLAIIASLILVMYAINTMFPTIKVASKKKRS